jgi:hypothetical protein
MKHAGSGDDNKHTATLRRFKFQALLQQHPDNKPVSVTVNYHSRVNHFDDHCRVCQPMNCVRMSYKEFYQ